MTRREGIGPHRIENGAIMKITSHGKDICFIIDCSNKPKKITLFHGKDVWMCARHHNECSSTSICDGEQ